MADDLPQRKRDHLRLALEPDAESGTTGLDGYRLPVRPFPEMALSEADPSCFFLGCRLSLPFIVAPMSGGGGAQSRELNLCLAAAARRHRVALALGSLRAALVEPARAEEFAVAAGVTEIPVLGNIGAWELRDSGLRRELIQLVRELQLAGLMVHTNVAQELVQPEGERDFRGALEATLQLLEEADFPVFLKEVGYGLEPAGLEPLVAAGIAGLDIAGGGGTDWVALEARRSGADPERLAVARALAGGARPTASALTAVRKWLDGLAPSVSTRPLLIASGGLRGAHQMAVALALGADLVSAARPVLAAAMAGEEELDALFSGWRQGLCALMTLAGCRRVAELSGRALIR